MSNSTSTTTEYSEYFIELMEHYEYDAGHAPTTTNLSDEEVAYTVLALALAIDNDSEVHYA